MSRYKNIAIIIVLITSTIIHTTDRKGCCNTGPVMVSGLPLQKISGCCCNSTCHCNSCQARPNCFTQCGSGTCPVAHGVPTVNSDGTLTSVDMAQIIECLPPTPHVACTKPPVCLIPRSVFIPRAIGDNTARELVGWQAYINRCTNGDNYITWAQTVGYSHSYRPERLARQLFGRCNLSFSGSLVPHRSCRDLLADQFGLSPNFQGIVQVRPDIKTIFVDTQFFFGFDRWVPGLYLRINAPIAYTRWNLNMCERNNSEDCTPFPLGYMANEQTPALCNAIEALTGDVPFGDLIQPQEFGKIVNGVHTKTGLADLDIAFGYNYYLTDISHFGFYLLMSAPTGNRPSGRILFEPIVGDGKHWQLGAGLSGHLRLWEEECKSLTIYCDANLTHMFKDRQWRSFDLCHNGGLSRFLLLKQFEKTDSGYSYTGNLVRAIDLTTLPVDVSRNVKGDVSIKLSFISRCLSFDIGYNFYGHSNESVHLCSLPQIPENIFYAVKGTEGVSALEYTTVPTTPQTFGPFAELLPTQSTQARATIHSGTPTNNAQFIPPTTPGDIVVTPLSRQTGTTSGSDVFLAQTSVPPVFVNFLNINKLSGSSAPTATNKLFTQLDYNFTDCHWWIPYLGIGGEVEIEALACNERTSLNQWSIWAKGGIAF